jgi:DNA replication protein DnaC
MVKFEGDYPDLSKMLGGDFSKIVNEKIKKEYREIYKILNSFVTNVRTGNGGAGLLLYGMNGGGKSFLGSAVINKLEELKKYPGVRVRAIDVTDDYCKEWRIPNLYRVVPVVFIDELGKELNVKPKAPSIMEQVLKWRFEHGALTILATNLTPEKIKDYYGETVNSLLRGRCVGVRVPDIDLRQEIVKVVPVC